MARQGPARTAASSPSPARTCARWRRRPRSAPTSCSSTSRTPSRPTTRSGRARNVIEALGAHDWSRVRRQRPRQRPRHALVLPRRRRRRGGARRGARHRAGAQGRLALRRGVRRDAAGPDRAAQRLGARPHRHPHPDRDRGGHGQRRGDRRARPDRLEAMVFGVADYAASVRARTTNIGGANPDYSVLTDPDAADGRARDPLGRPVALRHLAHGGGVPRRGPAPDRRSVRRLRRRRRLPQRRAPRRRAGLRGQVGDPPLAGRAGERGLHARPRPRSTARGGSCRRWRRRRRRARAPSRSTAG